MSITPAISQPHEVFSILKNKNLSAADVPRVQAVVSQFLQTLDRNYIPSKFFTYQIECISRALSHNQGMSLDVRIQQIWMIAKNLKNPNLGNFTPSGQHITEISLPDVNEKLRNIDLNSFAKHMESTSKFSREQLNLLFDRALSEWHPLILRYLLHKYPFNLERVSRVITECSDKPNFILVAQPILLYYHQLLDPEVVRILDEWVNDIVLKEVFSYLCTINNLLSSSEEDLRLREGNVNQKMMDDIIEKVNQSLANLSEQNQYLHSLWTGFIWLNAQKLNNLEVKSILRNIIEYIQNERERGQDESKFQLIEQISRQTIFEWIDDKNIEEIISFVNSGQLENFSGNEITWILCKAIDCPEIFQIFLGAVKDFNFIIVLVAALKKSTDCRNYGSLIKLLKSPKAFNLNIKQLDRLKKHPVRNLKARRQIGYLYCLQLASSFENLT